MLGRVDVLPSRSYAPRLDRGVQSSQDISGYRGQAAVSRGLGVKRQQSLQAIGYSII